MSFCCFASAGDGVPRLADHSDLKGGTLSFAKNDTVGAAREQSAQVESEWFRFTPCEEEREVERNDGFVVPAGERHRSVGQRPRTAGGCYTPLHAGLL